MIVTTFVYVSWVEIKSDGNVAVATKEFGVDTAENINAAWNYIESHDLCLYHERHQCSCGELMGFDEFNEPRCINEDCPDYMQSAIDNEYQREMEERARDEEYSWYQLAVAEGDYETQRAYIEHWDDDGDDDHSTMMSEMAHGNM